MKKIKTYWTFSTEYSEPEIGTWKIKGKWHMVRNAPEVFEVTISSASAESPVTTTALRAIPLTRIFEEQRAAMGAQEINQIWAAADVLRAGPHRSLVKAEDLRGSRQGVALDDALLQRTADEYRVAQISGVPVQQHIATVFNISRSTAAKRIMAARARGFIKEQEQAKFVKVTATPSKKNSSAKPLKGKSTTRKR
jgi:hypothetical protein